MTTTISVADIFIGRAAKYNQFSEGTETYAAQSCRTCVRRQFSYPYTCNDGWPAGNPQWRDRGAKCLNWTDKGNAKVD